METQSVGAGPRTRPLVPPWLGHSQQRTLKQSKKGEGLCGETMTSFGAGAGCQSAADGVKHCANAVF